MIRVAGICNGNPETTVLAHLNGGGMGMKHHDLIAAWSCSSCHDYVDNRGPRAPAELRERYLLDGIVRTQRMLLEQGVIKIT